MPCSRVEVCACHAARALVRGSSSGLVRCRMAGLVTTTIARPPRSSATAQDSSTCAHSARAPLFRRARICRKSTPKGSEFCRARRLAACLTPRGAWRRTTRSSTEPRSAAAARTTRWRPWESVAEWLQTTPTRRPSSRLKPSATSTCRPVWTGVGAIVLGAGLISSATALDSARRRAMPAARLRGGRSAPCR